MIVTHARNAAGERRVYLGGKSSLECWIEPTEDGRWTFHLDEAVTGNAVSDADKRAWAIHILMRLAEELAIAPADLRTTPFDRIAALHAPDPFGGRRIAAPPRKRPENAYMATQPGTTRPTTDFDMTGYRRQERSRPS